MYILSDKIPANSLIDHRFVQHLSFGVSSRFLAIIITKPGPLSIGNWGLHRHRRLDTRMGIVALQRDVLVAESKQVGDGRIEFQLG